MDHYKFLHGFALPTVVITATILLAVLVSVMSTVSSTDASVETQYYEGMASDAAESGIAMAKSCLAQSGGTATWTDASPLRPGGDCTGRATCSDASCYVVSSSELRTTFSVGAPSKSQDAVILNQASSNGSVDLLRKSDGSAWKTYKHTQIASVITALPVPPTIFVVDTTKSGCTSNKVALPIYSPVTAIGNSLVEWGDGTSTGLTAANMQHTYSAPGVYTIEYRGPIIAAGFAATSTVGNKCLTQVTQWSVNTSPTTMSFRGAANLTTMAEPPHTVTSMASMFYGATSFNQDISGWDTGAVTDTSSMFYGATLFNQPIGAWNVGAVTDMSSMFYSAAAFNKPLNSWSTGQVTNMNSMFYSAVAFNQALNSWSTGLVTNMSSMFKGASVFNGNIASWNVSSVTDMSYMFSNASAFNSVISSWNTANVTTMRRMFESTAAFNSPMDYVSSTGVWNVGKVTSMEGMFNSTGTFNRPIGAWDTSKVTDMSNMFSYAASFNQAINSWNVSAVTTMYFMFASGVFGQALSSWNVSSVTNMALMFSGAQSFNQPLNAWGTKTHNVTSMSSMFRWTYYNQPLTTWDTSNVTDMSQMFFHTINLNQDFRGWNVAKVTNHTDFSTQSPSQSTSKNPYFP